MPKRKRSYNARLVKETATYKVEEVADLFGTHKNTIRRWMKDGLQPIDNIRPMLIRGNILKQFLAQRYQASRKPCAADQFFCMKCREPRRAYLGMADFIFTSPTRFRIKAICEVCNTTLGKIQSAKNFTSATQTFRLQKLEVQHLLACVQPNLNSDKEA